MKFLLGLLSLSKMHNTVERCNVLIFPAKLDFFPKRPGEFVW